MSVVCVLCGSLDTLNTSYLSFKGSGFLRNASYLMPDFMANQLSKLSSAFRDKYRPVKINKQYFSGSKVYCNKCKTGFVWPQITTEDLDSYYKDFYWSNRLDHAGVACKTDVPEDINANFSEDRLSWIRCHVQDIKSAVDFGAGDCSGAKMIYDSFSGSQVFVVDKSSLTQEFSSKYGFVFFDSLDDIPKVDLLYSAHSIEHVSDIVEFFKIATGKLNSGGFMFFDTPNIANADIFKNMPHTPHTFMLSASSFKILADQNALEIVAIHECSREWGISYPTISDSRPSDLRVLLRKSCKI